MQNCNLKFNNIKLSVKHVRLMHDNKLNIKCIFNNFNFVTRKLRYLCRHFSNSHFFSENIFIPKNDNNNNFYTNISLNEGNIVDVNCDIDVDSRIINNGSELSINNCNRITNNIAMSILDLKVSHALPNLIVRSLVKVFDYIIDTNEELMIASLLSGIEKIDLCEDDRSSMIQLIKNQIGQGMSLENINTPYEFNTYIENNFIFVKPVEYRFSNINNNKNFHYIPIITMLNNFISIPKFRQLLKHCKSNTRYYIADIFDGSSFTQDQSSITLYLQLYIDEFEPCNPISANRGQHKLTAVYCCILNLPSGYRLREENIFLIILSNYNYIKDTENGYSVLFKPLLDDLKLLSNCIKYKAYVHFISADNLSAHDLSGYQMSFPVQIYVGIV